MAGTKRTYAGIDSKEESTKRPRDGDLRVDSATQNDSPVVVRKIQYDGDSHENNVPNISLSPTLGELMYPVNEDEFLRNYFRKKAVHITSNDGSRGEQHAKTRTSLLRAEMFNLSVDMIMRETSSDSVFLWKCDKATTKEGSKDSLISSVEVEDVDEAIALHKKKGHAVYCRAPPNIEQNLVASLLRATGMGCGQYDPSGESVVSMGRGEVETFISSPGHVTNFHFDFQENFTIQLSGIKRWILKQGTLRDPARGCTPHYAAPEAVESQLKAAHLYDHKFRFGHPREGITSTGASTSVELHAGDVFYFPAGLWHRVETVEPGVSINVSLMASTYASVTCQALQHLLYKDKEWREPVINNPTHNVVGKLKNLLSSLPGIIKRLEQDGQGVQAIIPPVLQFPPAFSTDVGEDEEEWNCDNEYDEEKMETDAAAVAAAAEPPPSSPPDPKKGCQESSTKNNLELSSEVKRRGDDDCTEDGVNLQNEKNIADEDDVYVDDDDNDVVDEEEGDDVDSDADFYMTDPVDADEYSYPDKWKFSVEPGHTVRLKRNPLAALHDVFEIENFYANKDDENSTLKQVFVLNINYAGNDTHQSAVRVVFNDNSSGLVRMLYEKERSDKDDAMDWGNATDFVADHGNIAMLKFLVFHGYLLPSCT